MGSGWETGMAMIRAVGQTCANMLDMLAVELPKGVPTWLKDRVVHRIGCCLARFLLLPSVLHFPIWCLWLLSKLDSH